MKKHSLTKEFSAGMIAASLGMLSTASLSPKQVHASSITPVVAQKSNQSSSTAVDTISNKLGWIDNDDYLKKLGINVNDLDSQNFLSIASLFHWPKISLEMPLEIHPLITLFLARKLKLTNKLTGF